MKINIIIFVWNDELTRNQFWFIHKSIRPIFECIKSSDLFVQNVYVWYVITNSFIVVRFFWFMLDWLLSACRQIRNCNIFLSWINESLLSSEWWIHHSIYFRFILQKISKLITRGSRLVLTLSSVAIHCSKHIYRFGSAAIFSCRLSGRLAVIAICYQHGWSACPLC